MKFRNLTFKGKPIFYGWVIVGGMGLMTMITMSMLSINFGFFIDPISRELGIEQGYFGWAQSSRLIGTAISGFIIGYLLDRYGARRPLMVAGFLIAGAMVAMANITEGWQIVAIFILIGLVGLHGAGANLYAIVSISQWFVRKRSKAMSRAYLGNPIGIFITAPLTVFLINSMGWRGTLLILGFAGGVIIFLVALLVRRSPEEMGLLPDGDFTDEVQVYSAEPKNGEQLHGTTNSTSGEYSWMRAEAIHSAAFWKLAVAFGLSMFSMSTTMLFRIPHFVSRGIDPQIVAYSLSIEAVVIFITTFPVGYLAAHLQLRYLLILSILVRMGAIFIMIVTTEVWHVFLANTLFGLSFGSQAIILGIIWPNYFGRKNVGSIRGLSLPVTTMLSFMGAPVAGMVFDAYGSYLPAWWAAIIILAVTAALFLVTPKPPTPIRSRAGTQTT